MSGRGARTMSMSVGSRVFTATGVLLMAAAMVFWWSAARDGSAAGAAALAVVAVTAAACGVAAAVTGGRAPHGVDADASDDAGVAVVLFAPVSYPAAAVVTAGAVSAIGAAATQPWLTAAGTLAGIVATIVQVRGTRATHRRTA